MPDRTSAASTDTTTAPRRRSASTILASVIATLLIIALLVFVLQNTEQAHIEFFGINLDIAQGFALLIAAVVGFLIAALGSGIVRLRRRVRHR